MKPSPGPTSETVAAGRQSSSSPRTLPQPSASAPAPLPGEHEPPRCKARRSDGTFRKGPPGGGARAPIRVSVVVLDDAARARLSAVIGDTHKLRLVSSHADVQAALREVPQARPDVTVIGSKSLLISKPEFLKRLRTLLPTRVLMFGTSPDSEPVLTALLAGAAGYVLQSAPPRELARAVWDVAHGRVSLCQASQQAMVAHLRRVANQDHPAPLTPRQQEISLLLSTHSEKEIAQLTNLSILTVHTHVKAVYRKHGVHSIEQLRSRLADAPLSVPGAPAPSAAISRG